VCVCVCVCLCSTWHTLSLCVCWTVKWNNDNCTHTHDHFTARWILSGTTWVSQYKKKHSPTHTYRGRQSFLICFIHLIPSMASSLTSAAQSKHTGLPLDPEIGRVDRSSRSFDVGVELSQTSRRKLSWSIESVVRLWSRVSRFSAVKSTFLTFYGWPSSWFHGLVALWLVVDVNKYGGGLEWRWCHIILINFYEANHCLGCYFGDIFRLYRNKIKEIRFKNEIVNQGSPYDFVSCRHT